MALVSCPHCSGTVSTKAANCPHCGSEVAFTTAPKPATKEVDDTYVTIIVIIVALLALGFPYMLNAIFPPMDPALKQ